MYPIMLSIRDRSCLVVGGGGVALRKVQGLLEDGARVTVVAPEVSEPIAAMADAGTVSLERRRFQTGDVHGMALVFAATDSASVNRSVADAAAAAGALVNVADDPGRCTFQLPARVRRGPLQLAVASEGEAPFVIRRLRQLLEHRLGPEWGEWIAAAGRFRSRVHRRGLNRAERESSYERFFRETVDGERLRARVPTAGEQESWLVPIAQPSATQPRRGPSVCREERRGPGLVSLVGAGPGCPGLLTVRGRQRLAEAHAVVFDRLAAPALPCDLPLDVELHPVGKTAGNHPVPQEEINALLVRLASAGKRVVRLKGGDPYVFGRGGEEAEELAAAGVPFEVVPGVTSGIAALAWAGIPVTHRREAVRVTLLTAHEAVKSDGPQVRWELLARDEHATIVGYMGVTALPTVVERLLEAGMDPETPAAVVQSGTTAGQRQVVSTLAELPEATVAAGIAPPALFAIGPTVRHAARLDWRDELFLTGQRLVVSSTAVELTRVLGEAGAEVVPVPIPVTPAARVVMGALPLTGCVLRSRMEVAAFDDEREGAGWESAVTWCIGVETARAAADAGWPDVRLIEEGVRCDDLVAQLGAPRRQVEHVSV